MWLILSRFPDFNLFIVNYTEFQLRLYGVQQIDKTSHPFIDKPQTSGDAWLQDLL